MTKPAYNPETEELYHIKGDQPGPGLRPGEVVKGLSSRVDVGGANKSGVVQMRYQDKVIEADIYVTREKDGSTEIMVHWMCPRCGHASAIRSSRKDVEWDGQNLSVEPFECPWELTEERDAANASEGAGASAGVILASANLCRLKLAVDRNIVRRA